MSLSDTARCEYLCQRKRQDGCCYLGFEMFYDDVVSESSVGCFWVQGGSADDRLNDTQALAVTCVKGKTNAIAFTVIKTIRNSFCIMEN